MLSSGAVKSPLMCSEKDVRRLEGCNTNVGTVLTGDVTSWGDCRAVTVTLDDELVRCSIRGFVAILVEELVRLIPDGRFDWELFWAGISLELDVRTSPVALGGGLPRVVVLLPICAKSPPSTPLSSSLLHEPASNLNPLPLRTEPAGGTIMALRPEAI